MGSARKNQGNHLPAKSPINVKIAIGSDDSAIAVLFGKPNQAGVSEIHRDAGVSLHQPGDWLEISFQLICNPDRSTTQKCPERVKYTASCDYQVSGLSENWFTGQKRSGERSKLADCPIMVSIILG